MTNHEVLKSHDIVVVMFNDGEHGYRFEYVHGNDESDDNIRLMFGDDQDIITILR